MRGHWTPLAFKNFTLALLTAPPIKILFFFKLQIFTSHTGKIATCFYLWPIRKDKLSLFVSLFK